MGSYDSLKKLALPASRKEDCSCSQLSQLSHQKSSISQVLKKQREQNIYVYNETKLRKWIKYTKKCYYQIKTIHIMFC